MVEAVTVYTGAWLKAGYLTPKSPLILTQGAHPMYNIFGFLFKEAGITDLELEQLPLGLAWDKARFKLPEYYPPLVGLVQQINDVKTLGEADREFMLQYIFGTWHIQLFFARGYPTEAVKHG